MLEQKSDMKQNPKIEFGEKLKRAREEKGMTQQTLADRLFVTRQAVSRWETGARYPELLTAKNIAGILEVSLDDLLCGEEMKMEVENHPVVERPVIKNILVALYACIAFSYALIFIDILVRFPLATNAAGPQEVQMLAIQGVGLCVNMIIFIYGLAMALKGSLTPRKTGTVVAVYFAAACLTGGMSSVVISGVMGKAILIRCIFLILPNILGSIAAVQYFGRKNGPVKWCYCLQAVSIYRIGSMLYGAAVNLKYGMGSMSMNRTLNWMLTIAVLCMVVYQGYITKWKRKDHAM